MIDVEFPFLLEPFSQHGPARHSFLWQHWGSIAPFQMWLNAEILRKSCSFYTLAEGFLILTCFYLHREQELSVLAAVHRDGPCPKEITNRAQAEQCFSSVQWEVKLVSSLWGYLWALFLRKGGRKITEWLYSYLWWKDKGKSAYLQVRLIGEGCWHPCATGGRSWHLDSAPRDGGWRDEVS